MDKFAAALATYQTFPEQFQSLILSTVSAEGQPNASYAPFVMDDDRNFYIYVSGLSSHTQNLHATAKASLLLIEDEAQTKQIFARTRLSYDCTATLVEAETPAWEALADQFQDRFGAMIDMLRQLPDFRIFRLQPQAGRLVIGFGAAFDVDPQDLSRLVPVTAS